MAERRLRAVKDNDDGIRPFADYAEQYWEAGWLVFPLPPGEKHPPPNRRTGRYQAPSWPDVKGWLKKARDENIGLRAPDGLIGIDVDDYLDKEGMPKNGGQTLKDLEDELHALPASWTSTARLDGVSGIRWFWLPGSPKGLHLPGNLGSGIEIVQFRHRYAVAPPSLHPEGERYKWYAPGQPLDGNGTFDPPILRRKKAHHR